MATLMMTQTLQGTMTFVLIFQSRPKWRQPQIEKSIDAPVYSRRYQQCRNPFKNVGLPAGDWRPWKQRQSGLWRGYGWQWKMRREMSKVMSIWIRSGFGLPDGEIMRRVAAATVIYASGTKDVAILSTETAVGPGDVNDIDYNSPKPKKPHSTKFAVVNSLKLGWQQEHQLNEDKIAWFRIVVLVRDHITSLLEQKPG